MHVGTFIGAGGVPDPDWIELFRCTELLRFVCCGEGLEPSPCDDTDSEELEDDFS